MPSSFYTKPPPLDRCPIMFVDIESGGLDPGFHEILELAWIVTDATADKILAQKACKVIPEHPERITAEAARINGYNEAEWKGATPIRQALLSMCYQAKHAVFAAHNCSFDWAMVEAALAANKLNWPGRYHRIDTVSLAWPLLQSGRIPNAKLGTLATYFGIHQDTAHRAGSDVSDCREVYRCLMKPWVGLLNEANYGEPIQLRMTG